MAALQVQHSPELKGLYANANRLTIPKGTVPRLCNLYLVRRGAFHTVPGSKWVSSFDGLAPHSTVELPLTWLQWYSPSAGSAPDQWMTLQAAQSVTPHNFILALQKTLTGVQLLDVSGATFLTLATEDLPVPTPHPGVFVTNFMLAQFNDYLIVGLGDDIAPMIFPCVTQLASNVKAGDNAINVISTIAFPLNGTIQIDSELIAYGSKTPTSFTSITRGAFGTTPAAHTAGALVYLTNGSANTTVVTTTLNGAILSTDATATVVDTTMFGSIGQHIYIAIDSEIIVASIASSTVLNLLTRGFFGTTAAGHSNGATVFEQQIGTLGVFLNANITAASTSIPLFGPMTNFGTTGFVHIDSECIQYAGISGSTLTGCTRGVAGTTAASHTAGAVVLALATEIIGTTGIVPWTQILNTFDPTLVYGGWPGTQNSFKISGDQAAVNIGTVIFVKDGAGIAWLFRAQNSGVTGAGNDYVGPQFFPQNGLIGTMASTTSGSTTLSLPTGTPDAYLFTAGMVGQPITVSGAGSTGDLVGTVVSVAGGGLSLVMSLAAGTTITGPAAYPIADTDQGAKFVIGVGHFGDTATDTDNVDTNKKKGNATGTEVWVNIGPGALNPPGAAFVFQHLDDLFLWGVGSEYGADGITGPDALWQSNFQQPTQFDPAKTTFVGKGDGSTAQGGAVFSLSEAGIAATPQLVLFKDASTYSFLNSFPNASLVPVSGGLGCVAPNTIQFIGGLGVMRLSYAGMTLFDGQLEHVAEYTDAIRGYLFGGLPDVDPVDWSNIQKCVSTQTVNPPLYMFFAPLKGNNGMVTRGFGYDLGLRQWFTMDLPFAISSAAFLPQAAAALSQAFQSLIGGANDGVVRRIFSTDTDWDGIDILYKVRLPDWGFPGTPLYARRLNLLITPDGDGKTPKLVSVFFQGIRRSGQAFGRFLNLPRSLIGSMDIGETVLNGNVQVEGTGQVLIEGSDVQISEKPMARVGA